ncbi:hypothetical protein H0A71_06565 [Alcaligenaceae bacterium]|nr:hypothetical protein [Alcaligenaceae bacterium]
MAKAIEIIERAFKRIGVLAAGESISGHELLDGMQALSDLLEMWSADRLTIYKSIEIAHPLTGAMRYSIGPTGDISADRPLTIYSAFVRNGAVDTPVWVTGNNRFDGITDKSGYGRPEYLRYTPDMPDGHIDIWPHPGTGSTLHLRVGMQFDVPVAPADDLVLPPGYRRALALALAVDLCGVYGRPVAVDLIGQAVEAKAIIMRNNINADMDESSFDPFLSRRHGSFVSG